MLGRQLPALLRSVTHSPHQARSPDALPQPRFHPSTHAPPCSAAYRPTLPQKVVTAPDTSATAGKFDFSGFKDGQLWVALITFLYGEHSAAQHSSAQQSLVSRLHGLAVLPVVHSWGHAQGQLGRAGSRMAHERVPAAGTCNCKCDPTSITVRPLQLTSWTPPAPSTPWCAPGPSGAHGADDACTHVQSTRGRLLGQRPARLPCSRLTCGPTCPPACCCRPTSCPSTSRALWT